jgi:hypothetical protein
MNQLYQCPYEPACKCKMDEPCPGCESFNPERLGTENAAFRTAADNMRQERDELRTEALAYQATVENLRGKVERYQAMCAELIVGWKDLLPMQSWFCGDVYNQDHVDDFCEDFESAYRAMTEKDGE